METVDARSIHINSALFEHPPKDELGLDADQRVQPQALHSAFPSNYSRKKLTRLRNLSNFTPIYETVRCISLQTMFDEQDQALTEESGGASLLEAWLSHLSHMPGVGPVDVKM